MTQVNVRVKLCEAEDGPLLYFVIKSAQDIKLKAESLCLFLPLILLKLSSCLCSTFHSVLVFKFICLYEQLFSTYLSFSSEHERKDISRSLKATEDWLYDDGDDETVDAYSAKLEDLKQVTFVSPISMFHTPYFLLTISIFYSWWIQLSFGIKTQKQDHKLQEIC